MNKVSKVAFSRPFCLRFTLKTGEVVERERDAAETAKKCDGGQNTELGGSDPL